MNFIESYPKIDYVFPYVNPNDPTWRLQYKYCLGTECKNSERFRDFSLLKYIFRSIEQNANWLNKVHLIVSYKSQIPSWVNTSYNRLSIIEHKDYIPSLFLPTFNSNTIEAFLGNIEGVSNRFLYGNDDFLFLNKTKPIDFFTETGLLKVAYVGRHKVNPTGFLNTCKRTWDIVANKYGEKYVIKDINIKTGKPARFIKQWHGASVPMLMKDVKAVYKDLEKEILQSLTMTRNVYKNFNQYINTYYSIVHGHTERTPANYIGVYTSIEDNNVISSIRDSLAKMICINDTAAMTKEDITNIYKELDKKFPKKSLFERK